MTFVLKPCQSSILLSAWSGGTQEVPAHTHLPLKRNGAFCQGKGNYKIYSQTGLSPPRRRLARLPTPRSGLRALQFTPRPAGLHRDCHISARRELWNLEKASFEK